MWSVRTSVLSPGWTIMQNFAHSVEFSDPKTPACNTDVKIKGKVQTSSVTWQKIQTLHTGIKTITHNSASFHWQQETADSRPSLVKTKEWNFSDCWDLKILGSLLWWLNTAVTRPSSLWHYTNVHSEKVVQLQPFNKIWIPFTGGRPLKLLVKLQRSPSLWQQYSESLRLSCTSKTSLEIFLQSGPVTEYKGSLDRPQDTTNEVHMKIDIRGTDCNTFWLLFSVAVQSDSAPKDTD